jgi:hypothetical protein
MSLTDYDGTETLHNGGQMMINRIPETLVEMRVTYTIELNGQIFMIENVPARVNEETGEQLFAPSTVESIQRLILNQRTPDRFTEVPVYDYAA